MASPSCKHVCLQSLCFLKRNELLFKTYVTKLSPSISSVLSRNFLIHASYLNSQKINSASCCRKDVSGEFPKSPELSKVEAGWYEWWQEAGFFKPEFISPEQLSIPKEQKQVFSLVLPPPNVTGSLHLGHALTIAIEDALARWKRMNGCEVVWVPGFDHAGIATQVVVEKKLWQEQRLKRQSLGREKFVEEVSKWKDEKIEVITQQMKRLGASLDFSRTAFTMDENMSRAVKEAFVRLFDDGLIYRDQKFVNWSCFLQSVISDIEVEHLQVSQRKLLKTPGSEEPIEVGILEKFAYPISDTSEEVIVATTRLESMLGDTAVAVHPSDDRFKHMIGKTAVNPFTKRHLPIIADESVDMNMGTGAVKITPAHHPIDYQVAKKHQLDSIEILDDAGNIREGFEKYEKLSRFAARKQIKKDLEALGLYRGQVDHEMAIPVCIRTGDIIEPRLMKQWFIDCSSMAKRAVEAVEEGHLQLIPKYNESIWFNWLKDAQDWCISRQLWWGHRIPAYRIISPEMEKSIWVSGQTEEIAAAKAAKKLNVDVSEVKLQQDTDVLDTWFSSALFPISAFSWPEKTEDLKKFCPLALMETGHDILFFWVARMVMLCEHFTQKLPFKKVLLHGMVCDAYGRKMSKSLGNVINLSDVIKGVSLEDLQNQIKESHRLGYLTDKEVKTALEGQRKCFPEGIPECGADSLRFALCMHDVKNQIISIDVKQIRSCRHFCNKIWQGTKFLFTSLEKRNAEFKLQSIEELREELTPTDQWILSCLSKMIITCNKSFDEFNLHLCTSAIKEFWTGKFCDVYVESVKPILRSDDDAAAFRVSSVLLTCIRTMVLATSPFMPYLSEEIYQRLSEKFGSVSASSVCVASYPKDDDWLPWYNKELEMQMEMVDILINSIRSKLVEHKLKTKPEVVISVKDKSLLDGLESFSDLIMNLARVASVRFVWAEEEDKQEIFVASDGWVSSVLSNKLEVWMKIEALKDVEYQLADVSHKLSKVQKELQKLMKVMSHNGYHRKAPMNVKESNIAKKASLEAQLQELRDHKRRLEARS